MAGNSKNSSITLLSPLELQEGFAMGTLIAFPIYQPPRPFRPSTAARRYLDAALSDAVMTCRIPAECKQALMAEAFESNCQFSRHIAGIVVEHLKNYQGLHCVLAAGQESEIPAKEEKTA